MSEIVDNNEVIEKSESSSSLKTHLLKSLPLMLLAIVFVFIFNRQGLLADLETVVLDTQMMLNAPTEKSQVVIVEITQDDFKNIFEQKTRPLNPEKLHQLISAISAGKPCLIGVDIFTNYDGFSREKFKVDEKWSPIIWIRDSEANSDNVDDKPDPIDVLGGQSEFNKDSGMPDFIIENGMARYYQREFETAAGNLPSLDWAIFQKAKQQNCGGIKFPKLESDTTQRFVGYTKSKNAFKRDKVSASLVLKLAEQENWKDSDLLKDKIVLLGASYLNEDRHRTPFGEMLGVEVHANIIETELRGGGIIPPGFLTTALLSLFDGFLLVGLFHIFSGWRAFLYSLFAIVFLSLLCSLAMYYSFAYWAFFAPVMLGVLLTELFDRGKDYLKGHYKDEINNAAEKIKDKYFHKENEKEIEDENEK